jgi:hypothetical protein
MSRIWFFPDPKYGFDYERTEDFVTERFGKATVWEPEMQVLANSPGEAVLKFHRYVEAGRALNAYK